MGANIAIVAEAAEHIAEWPEHHAQEHWVSTHGNDYTIVDVRADNGEHPDCGTTLCWAGWIAFLNAPAGSTLHGTDVKLPDGWRETISSYAKDVAGLSDDQAGVMFHGITGDRESQVAQVLAVAAMLERDPDASGFELHQAAAQARSDYPAYYDEDDAEAIASVAAAPLH